MSFLLSGQALDLFLSCFSKKAKMTISAVEIHYFIVICFSAEGLSYLWTYWSNLLTHLACSSLLLAAVVSYIVLLSLAVSSVCNCLLNRDFLTYLPNTLFKRSLWFPFRIWPSSCPIKWMWEIVTYTSFTSMPEMPSIQLVKGGKELGLLSPSSQKR